MKIRFKYEIVEEGEKKPRTITFKVNDTKKDGTRRAETEEARKSTIKGFTDALKILMQYPVTQYTLIEETTYKIENDNTSTPV